MSRLIITEFNSDGVTQTNESQVANDNSLLFLYSLSLSPSDIHSSSSVYFTFDAMKYRVFRGTQFMPCIRQVSASNLVGLQAIQIFCSRQATRNQVYTTYMYV
jgi:hypothetical protein